MFPCRMLGRTVRTCTPLASALVSIFRSFKSSSRDAYLVPVICTTFFSQLRISTDPLKLSTETRPRLEIEAVLKISRYRSENSPIDSKSQATWNGIAASAAKARTFTLHDSPHH